MQEAKRIAVIPGDGIGKEVTREGVKVLEAACALTGQGLAFAHFDWGAEPLFERRHHAAR